MTKIKVLFINLNTQKIKIEYISPRETLLGGSGLAAWLYEQYGLVNQPADHPKQPLIFSIGPLTGLYPMMSKVVMAFKSPYNQQYTESHAGGRLSLAIKFSGYHAIVIQGKCPQLSVIEIGDKKINFFSTPFLKQEDVFNTGKILRKISTLPSGKRSILRIGPAGENQIAIACVNVDTYRHFGRLGGGAIFGAKNLKGIIIGGNSSYSLQNFSNLKEYNNLYQQIYNTITTTKAVHKYHDLGTAQNLITLNELKCLPWNNLQKTSDPGIKGISGELFAQKLLLRKTACSGCPVGCIHIGILREQFAKEHEYLYRQVSYDYEPIFALGSMLGIKKARQVLKLLEQIEKVGLDAISSGVLLAYVTEGLEKKLFHSKQTLVNLKFGQPKNYLKAIDYLGTPPNNFWQILSKGLKNAIQNLGGEDFACVLGQEMAGYATGENYFVAQALGFRHSHLDIGAYSYDLNSECKDIQKALKFFQKEENYRVILTSCVGCLFARKAYPLEILAKALSSVDLNFSESELFQLGEQIAAKRWNLKIKTGFDPLTVRIPKRFLSVKTFKGKIDKDYLQNLQKHYANYIKQLANKDFTPTKK
ncbi:aldehyde ferredoxin oxidoreductase N-terminal domain-containing protein [Desulfonauticus submarinus]